MYSKPPQYPENPLWAHEATCPATVFFFPRLAGQDSFILKFGDSLDSFYRIHNIHFGDIS